jgi:hypothetical protein
MNRAKTKQEDNMQEPGKSKGMYDPDEDLWE